MTRDQQIRKALELLTPPPRQRAECQHDIKVVLDRVERGAAAARSFRLASSKKGKAGLKGYCAALRRLRNAYYALDPAIRPWFSLAETAYVTGKPTFIDSELAMAEAFLARPSPPPRRDASRNKAAVAAAYDLLDWWGHRTVSRHRRRRAGSRSEATSARPNAGVLRCAAALPCGHGSLRDIPLLGT